MLIQAFLFNLTFQTVTKRKLMFVVFKNLGNQFCIFKVKIALSQYQTLDNWNF